MLDRIAQVNRSPYAVAHLSRLLRATGADGEALLGWLNLSATLSGPEFDGNEFLRQLGSAIRERLDDRDMGVARLVKSEKEDEDDKALPSSE